MTSLEKLPVSVWGANQAGNVVVREGATLGGSGHAWKVVDGALRQIAADGGGLVWGVNNSDDVYRRVGISQHQPLGTHWEHVQGKLRTLSIAPQFGAAPGVSVVWGTNTQGQIFVKTDVTAQSEGRPWKQLDGQLAQIHADYGGAVWGVSAGGQIYRRRGISAQDPDGQGWEQVDGALKFVTVAAQLGAALGTSVVWGVNASDDIFVRLNVTEQSAGSSWQQISGKLSQIHADAAGAVWGVNSSQQVFRRVGLSAAQPTGTDWVAVDGALIHVCVATELDFASTTGSPVGGPGGMGFSPQKSFGFGAGHSGNSAVWGVNHSGQIYVRHGATVHSPGANWQQTDGALKHISTEVSGQVWGVNANGDIYRRTGVTPHSHVGSGWAQVDGKLDHLTIAPQLGAPHGTAVVWGANTSDDIFVRTGVNQDGAGNAWQQVEGKLNRVSVDANGVVLGANAGDDIYRRTGVTAQNPAGSGWTKLDGQLKVVASGPQCGAPQGTSIIWGVNGGGNIYYRLGASATSDGAGWVQAPGQLVHIHADAAGAVWGTNSAGNIFHRTGISPSTPAGTDWAQVEGGLAVVASNARA